MKIKNLVITYEDDVTAAMATDDGQLYMSVMYEAA